VTDVNLRFAFVISIALCTAVPAIANDPAYDKEMQQWREAREKSLRADNG
jgi:hypothetical protein